MSTAPRPGLSICLARRSWALASAARGRAGAGLLARAARHARRALKVARFTPGPGDLGTDPEGVIVASACKRCPTTRGLTLAAVAWDAGKPDSKALVLALVDEKASPGRRRAPREVDEDAATRRNGSLRLDTAAYELAPGVRAFGLDIFQRERRLRRAARARAARCTCATAPRCARSSRAWR